MASFHLHQACESFFYAISLTFNQYKPKEHDIPLVCNHTFEFMKFALANVESQVPETLNPFHQHFHILFMNHKFLIVTGLYIGRPQQFEQVFIFCLRSLIFLIDREID